MVSILTVFAGLIALTAAYVYFIGIPPEMKRKLEQQALRTMGENKMSYVVKGQIEKLPTGDQAQLNQVKSGVGNLTGGALKNPLGEQSGEAADRLTSPFTGR